MPVVTRLMSFLGDRWQEEQRDAALFHEFDCPGPVQAGRVSRCSCPCPAQILDRVATDRRIVRDCEQRIRREQDRGLCWSVESVRAFQVMKAFALPYELHPGWQESWRP
ncbi:hypothetical protein J8N05_46780 (plasmid) [Streptomyces sp. BH-SS-21]|uniref:Uncharacterized protein n=1 Tax=Streptomyces liliiviolaceus TaxID=2823109 RepID=A0A940Y4W8_9ACTN|nr:DUF6221 family protein [Streptomyces liliiviolaceus]MBQ0855668.1 hypothetical protein [Streptomyces liliiviolaceus]